MKTFSILVEEQRSTIIEVQAKDIKDAKSLASDMYDAGTIMLKGDDIGDVTIEDANNLYA